LIHENDYKIIIETNGITEKSSDTGPEKKLHSFSYKTTHQMATHSDCCRNNMSSLVKKLKPNRPTVFAPAGQFILQVTTRRLI